MYSWLSTAIDQRSGYRSYKWAALLLAILLALPIGVVKAGAVNGNLPGGTSISVAINSPADGAVLPPGNVPVSGTASVGQGKPVANTALVYVLDVSGSTVNSGTGCGGDQNGDGLTNSVLDCEIAAAKTLNGVAVSNGSVGEVAVAVFGDSGATADVSSDSGDQPRTGPATDANSNSDRDVEEVLSSVHSHGTSGAAGVTLFTSKTPGSPGGGSTNFAAGIQAALNALGGSTKPNKLVIYMSDGLANNGGTVASALSGVSGVVFDTFAVGASSSCTINPSGRGSLSDIASLTGGGCTPVPNVASLPGIVPGVISSKLTSLQMSIDGGAPTDISSSAAPALPQTGPAAVNYSTSTGPLGAGSHTICVTANGSDGGGDGNVQDCHTIIINAPPTADAQGPYSGDEGSAIALNGAASDPENDPLAISWGFALVSGVDSGATCTFANGNTLTPSITCTDDGTYKVTLTVDDGHNPPVSSDATLTVANVAPQLTITAPASGALYAVNTPVNLGSSFSDAGTNDQHTCAINWDDMTNDSFAASEASGSGTCNQTHTFAAAGVYTIQVKVTDDDGGADTKSVMVVVYDPNAGFVTGGGWINSPAGAYTANPSLTGRANFGFVSKYQKGATTPTGQTEFQFQAAGFNFHSESYKWLVVAGPKAQYKGTGTVNGASGYGFLLTATDGQVSGGGGVDKFRMKVWDLATSAVVYDNALGASDDIDAANPLAISGGSIVIHAK